MEEQEKEVIDMRTFTTEEKEQIMRMPINSASFERPSFNYDDFSEECIEYRDLICSELWLWNHELIPHLNILREMYFEYKDDRIFEMFIRLLPNSNKVIKS